MLPWNSRPIEIANLFNPAFCSVVLKRCVDGYCSERNNEFPFALSFLILPIVLHKQTREHFPTKISVKMHAWLQDHPELRMNFAKRVIGMSQFTREALIYAIPAGLINVKGSSIGSTNRSIHEYSKALKPESESFHCLKNAHFLGRWFAQAGELSTIYLMWGISV